MGKYWEEKRNGIDEIDADDFNNAFNLIANDMAGIKKTAGKAPYIGNNGNWYEWDSDSGEYVDTGIMAKGYTPIKGRDYWTEEDKAEIISEIPSGGTWKTLIDTTLTEEQAGVSKVAIEIPDWANILRTATRLRMWIDIAIPEDMASQVVRIQISDYNGQAYSAHLCWSSASAKAGQTLHYLGVTEILPITTLNRRECITFYSAPTVYTGANAANSPTKIHSDVRLTNLSANPPYFVVYLANGGIMGAGTKIFVEACE